MLDTNFWKKYFKVYDLLNELTPYQLLIRTICHYADVKKGDRVLDAGAGTGNLVVELEKIGAIVTALDYSREGLEIIRLKGSYASLVCADLTKPLDFGDNSFDKIVSNNTLYTIPKKDRPTLMKEFFRVLKPGGTIVLSNISTGFKPIRIYLDHLKNELKYSSIWALSKKVLRLGIPTLKIFYYNEKIRKENKTGSYDFYRFGEQTEELKTAGFINILPETRVYSDQALLVVAHKPFH
jgi:ubiquinone/menaquinone biosynthesis C-methylase UbiE